MTQGVQEQIGAIAAIEAKLHLFQVGWKVFSRDAVPRSRDTALEERERGFDGVSVNVSHDVHARTVIDSLVVLAASLSHCSKVRHVVIGENHVHVLRDVLADVTSKGARLRVVCVEEAEIAVALADADDHFLVIKLSDLAFVAIPTADIGNVHLHFAIQHRLISLRHRMANAMAKIPSGLVGHSDGPLDLQSGHTLFGFAEQMRNEEPFRERQVCIVENSSSRDGKLIVAVFAVEELFFGFEANDGHLAAQAARTFGPAQAHQQFPAFLFGPEQSIDIN